VIESRTTSEALGHAGEGEAKDLADDEGMRRGKNKVLGSISAVGRGDGGNEDVRAG
jgi:hypothetical protein